MTSPINQILLMDVPAPVINYDPATASANVVLSNNNLTLAKTSSGSTVGAHFVAAGEKTSGKYYYEVTYDVLTSASAGGVIGVGLVGTTFNQFFGGTNSVGAATNGNLLSNGSFPYNFGGRSQGQVIGCAIDLDNRLAWFRVDPSGAWNGATANGDPDTLVNGLTIVAGTMLPYCVFGSDFDTYTTNFGASSFVGSVPSGFTAGWPQ